MKNWLGKNIVTKTIQGEEVAFRRIPVGILQKCRGLNEDVAKAVGMVFKDKSHDVEIEQLTSEGGSSYRQTAAQASVLSMRKTQIEQGIKSIMDAVTKDDTMDILCDIIVYSAWEEFSPEDAKDLKNKMDPITMFEFLKGALEASAGDYAELGKSLLQKNPTLKAAIDQVKEAVK